MPAACVLLPNFLLQTQTLCSIPFLPACRPLCAGNIDVVDVTNPLEHTTHEVQLQIHPGEQPRG